MIKIYTLTDPITQQVRYVGKTKYSLNDRLCKHMLTNERNYRGNWIRSLKKKDLRPIIELVEEVNETEWAEYEKYWIAQFKCWGFSLVNLSEGGESGVISTKCREACIRANTGLKHSRESIEKRIMYTSKPVIVLDKKSHLHIEFKSASEAARQLNCYISHITECCNGIRKSHKGFKFSYRD